MVERHVGEHLVAAIGRVGTVGESAPLATAAEVLVHQILGAEIVPVEQRLADLRQVAHRVDVVGGAVDATAPHGDLVEDQSLAPHLAAGHQSEPTVADREHGLEDLGRAVVAELERGLLSAHREAEDRREDQ